MKLSHPSRAGTKVLLSIMAVSTGINATFTCTVNNTTLTTGYNATTSYLGCYLDPKVSILTAAKLSTIAMTPEYCATWCGKQGFAYGGIEFGTQCFCGSTPDLSTASKTNDSSCNSGCSTDPSSSCGGTYVMSLYKILNPQGNVTNTGFVPACQTQPLCSHQVCDTSLSIAERVDSLVNSLTLEEKILNLVDASAGSARLGLPSYEWWNEATHGIGSAPGVQFTSKPANFSYATSFPAPILMAAAFDDAMIRKIAQVIGKEGRAFANKGFSGFDFWAPNINGFRDPRWGRGQETLGEDIFVAQSYVRNFIPGLQGDDPQDKQVIATCKHFAVYDLETGRYGNNYNPTQQDLSDYFLAPFKTCVRDTDVGSVMCSYNAVSGIPACANEYLLEEVLRKHWNFSADYHYVVSDCGAVTDIWQYHNFTDTEEGAASVALNAGVDLECGSSYLKLNASLAANQTSVEALDQALNRLYSALFTVGFFDGGKYMNLDFSDVSTPAAQALAYEAAVEGMTLLKNDKLLPLGSSHKYKSVAVIGPFANATTQMQGDYSGNAPFLISPLEAFESHQEWKVNYAFGTAINNDSTAGVESALTAAEKSDLIVYLGGIDNSLESETLDRISLAWPQNQLDLIMSLSKLSKPMIVVQFGGGQVDDSVLLKNKDVQALVWAGYPSQSGGPALLDVLLGRRSFAGRLPVTQYPASYADQVSIFNIGLRPNLKDSNPGRTYKWYSGKPVIPFGYGLHYTNFEFEWEETLNRDYNIQKLIASCQRSSGGPVNDNTPFATVKARVKNVGHETSDYVSLLFLSSTNAGPTPRPNKSLVSYIRLHNITSGSDQVSDLPLTLGSLARADENGSLVIFPGHYKIALDISDNLTFEFTLSGDPAVIDTLPTPSAQYNFTVPVNLQPPSTEAHS
ncbi:glycoside hydrolase superfamily [Penicillium daleae]|uniref:xylan 1,4-beta-xylosidase n=1 Tax=Penicillium daleae TaxID=63821 RepID=A0AAD6C506_9EURO|nr:glycoside hydrolase superfamily [Penicillium daleae]KAJ5449436.1 glycoside hydrolase superfamily [Penicillium daleae]